MKITRTLFFTFLLLSSQNALCQKNDLKTLIKVYNSQSISTAFTILQEISSFTGTLSPGINELDSSIKGTLDNGEFKARKQGGKITILHYFEDASIFERLKAEAGKSLFFQESESGESMGAKRMHFLYSNVRKIKDRDLELILSRCVVTETGAVYFQLDLIPHSW